MKKIKGILVIGIFSLAILLCGTKTVNAAATVNNEEDLIAYIESSTQTECILGDNITLTKILTVKNYDKVIDLNGKHLASPDKSIAVEGVKLTINDSVGTGKYTCDKDYGIYALDNGTVIVNGGTFESLYSVLAGNNTTGEMNFEVNGGTLTAKNGAAIYMPGQVSLKITNGTINGGINARMGQINITGGTINNNNDLNGDSIQEYYSYSGNVWYNSAITFTTGTYETGNDKFGNSLNVKISGGTFNSTIGNIVSVYGLGKVKQDVNISISGGTFNGKDADVVVYDTANESFVTKPEYKVFKNDNKLAITGGNFEHSVEKYLASGYIQNKTDKYYTVKENVVLDYTDSKTGETLASFESKKPLDKNYKLVVEEKKFNNEESTVLNKDIKDSVSKLYDDKKSKVKDANTIATYDISISDGKQIVKIEGTDKYKIYLKVNPNLTKNYSNFKVAYLDENNVVKEILEAKLVNGNIEFITNHLSTYTVIGYNTESITNSDDKTTTVEDKKDDNTENTTNIVNTANIQEATTPKTGDNIVSYVGILVIGILGSVIILFKKSKMNRINKH